MTIQLIRDKETGEDFFIEINPRFGGGAPLSMKAGANSAKTLLQILIGENIDEIDSIRDGEIYSRFDQSVCINKTTIGKPIKGIIFDLDDTLYDEKQYIKSGFKAVSEYLKVDDAADKMWAYYNAGEQAIDKYLYEIAQLEKKTECLMVYRNHMPNITLSNNVGNLLVSLKEKGFKIGIITDGRPNGQHNKISALELDRIVDDVIVTDELGGEQFRKPCDIAFRIMQKRWRIPFEQIIYLGDNVDKDFQAPKQLGMQYMLINNGNGIYATSKDGETISKAIEKVKFWHEARK
jgi:FMN phosphatase YigB (HAD superfamily)